jgi:hypothetical protein
LFKDCGPGVCGISQIGCSDDEQQIFPLRLGQWFTADSICIYAADLSSIMEAIQICCFVSYLKLDFPCKVHRYFSLSVPWVVVKGCAYHGGAAGPSVCSVCFSYKGSIKRCQWLMLWLWQLQQCTTGLRVIISWLSMFLVQPEFHKDGEGRALSDVDGVTGR